MPKKRKVSRFAPQNVLAFFLKEERRSSILLLIAAVLALILANSSWASIYFGVLHHEYTLGAVTLDLRHWINEGLMAIFFLVVVLEIKREFIDGELRSWKKASFLVFAALGGMIVPALIFSVFNPYPPQNIGWAIPMSTDTAIALGVIGLLGRSVPRSLKVFLLAVAIIDDVVSIIVIGLYYSRPTNMFFLFLALAFSMLLIYARTKKLRLFSFAIIGFAIWYCLLMAGVSGTIAGVVVAAIAPLTTRRTNAAQLQGSEVVEDMLLPVTAFFIVPLFVFANAGLDFSKVALTHGNGLMVFVGVALGLAIGKPVGIFAGGWLAATLRIGHKPNGISWPQIWGVGCISGIGFTISILIADLAYKTTPDFHNTAILGVFVASIISGVAGVIILKYSRRKPLLKTR
ncbi:MAG: Na+/H+ antiporter NhaA [Patescibacteria group bacterium]